MGDSHNNMLREKMYENMWNRYQTGKITQKGWINFCKWYMWNVIMVHPEVIEIMVRMKYN